jgi:lipopolysaccharide transport system ATP-binding protein
MSEKAIIVEGLWKGYQLGSRKSSNLRDALMQIFESSKKEKDIFWALQDVNFTINKGDAVGIIGRNGAGKSTLLKILSRITSPTKGSFQLNGRVSSLLEVGTGFHAELTGRENIYLNGTILGMSRAEVKLKFDEIVAFSGIEKFIDTPVKRYSSGMYVRLAFAVAAHLEPEILIVDEVLAVGDAEFQKKCLGKMKDVSTNEGRTVIFVSHNMGAVKSLCNVGMLLNKGQLNYVGGIEEAVSNYLNTNINSGKYISLGKKEDIDISFKEIFVADYTLKECTEFNTEDDIIINFKFNIKDIFSGYSVFCTINNKYGNSIFSAEKLIEKEELQLHIKSKFLTRGTYSINTFIHIPKVHQIDRVNDACSFSIVDTESSFVIHGDFDYGNVFGNYQWK